MIGDLPERYVPDGPVAEGGFGSVLFCDDLHLERKVAIKVVKEEVARRRISDEIQALLKLRSKHVVQVFDVVVSPTGEIGIVQEFIDGEDLFDSQLPRSSLSEYLKTLWQLASGIADIHSVGLIHRDIKPNNMKLGAEGVLKLFDFGLARREGPAAHTVGFVGTVGFAAPELYDGGAFTQAVDVYAFGASALNIGAGILPVDLRRTPPRFPVGNPFTTLPFQLERHLADLLHSCLAPQPDARPPIHQVRDVLGRYLLRNSHQALAVYNGKASYLNASEPLVTLDYPGVGSIEIEYDGLSFLVKSVAGEVYVNNSEAHVGAEIPGSCVVALGSSVRPPTQRRYVTFDVSNPEVVL